MLKLIINEICSIVDKIEKKAIKVNLKGQDCNVKLSCPTLYITLTLTMRRVSHTSIRYPQGTYTDALFSPRAFAGFYFWRKFRLEHLIHCVPVQNSREKKIKIKSKVTTKGVVTNLKIFY